MKKYLLSIFLSLAILITGCGKKDEEKVLKFAVSADYPPFEYREGAGAIIGFDIELAGLIAKQMDMEAIFEDMRFANIFAAVQSGAVDAGISTITVTEEREKNFDFSDVYYREEIAILSNKGEQAITDKSQLRTKKIACQLGTTMEIWLKENAKDTELVLLDNNPQAVEALKAGRVDGVLIDLFQAQAFAQKNIELEYTSIAKSEFGYAIAIKKGSELREKINSALRALNESGEIAKLAQKWLGEI
ncbi:ABC transporter substrate-binding protein [Candidatus Lariskella endosymbiont of Hedychridium roseum]|uniref:ABC transporter substrate-binding protein n=1 Tax=Candidatus Lariskella endosymbiont of Hedychridium roseum TaxID=3077949 RepID=UPI0030CF60F7